MWLIFIIGYGLIALAEKIHINKAATALATGGALMFLAASRPGAHFTEELTHAGAETMGVVGFLLCAMTLVEILVHYQFFDWVRYRLTRLGLGNMGQFWAIAVATFFCSAALDNLTTTIVMLRIASMFFSGGSMFIAACAIISAANSGGAWSPIGDVTTFMLWQAGKITASEVVKITFLPSMALFLVTIGLLSLNIKPAEDDTRNDMVTSMSRAQWLIISMCLVSFTGPFFAVRAGLPAFTGLMLGLGIVWFVQEAMKKALVVRETSLDIKIHQLMEKLDTPSLLFFVGILAAVTSLHMVGALEVMIHALYGEGGERSVFGHVVLGLASAVFDNVPLTAMAIQALPGTDGSLWALLAFTVGTGGSLLVIGSAAGVVAIGILDKLREERGEEFVPALSFGAYAKAATLPNLIGYTAGVAIWWLMNQ